MEFKNICNDLSEKSEIGELDACIVDTNTEDLYNWLNQYNYEQFTDLFKRTFNKVCLITALGINEQYRGEGFGSELLDRCVLRAKGYNAEVAILVADVFEVNKFKLEKWYQKKGFNIIDETEINPLMVLKL